MKYFPVYLDLKNKAVLVVGGGTIAEGKARQLIDAGARIKLVSPELTPILRGMSREGVLTYHQKRFASDDLNGIVLVISATDDRVVNEAVAREAERRGLLCNIVDQPALCNFITPALVTRGDLQISISSGGGSPSVTQRVKSEIADLIGEEYGELLEVAAGMRADAKKLIPDFDERKKVLHEFVRSEALELIKAGRRREAQDLAQQILQLAVKEGERS